MVIKNVNDKTCTVCGKHLANDNSTGLCYKHLVEKKHNDRLNYWLTTGKTGYTVETTIRGVIRDYIMNEQNNKCAICGINNEWNGAELVFIMDHIDGDASNSRKENLRLICPNCDSQLPTYKSRNKNSARNLRKQYIHNNHTLIQAS